MVVACGGPGVDLAPAAQPGVLGPPGEHLHAHGAVHGGGRQLGVVHLPRPQAQQLRAAWPGGEQTKTLGHFDGSLGWFGYKRIPVIGDDLIQYEWVTLLDL